MTRASDDAARLRIGQLVSHQVTLRLLQPPISRLLDVGCGDGGLCRLVAARGDASFVVGADRDLRTLNHSSDEDRHQRAPAFIRGDALALPFRSQSFDAVTMVSALAWTHPNEKQALSEIHRVLTRRAQIILVTLINAAGPHFTSALDSLVIDTLRTSGLAALVHELPRLASIHSTRGQLAQLLLATGFRTEIVRSRYNPARKFRNGREFVAYLQRTVGDFYWRGQLVSHRAAIKSAIVRTVDARLAADPAYGIPFRTIWLRARAEPESDWTPTA